MACPVSSALGIYGLLWFVKKNIDEISQQTCNFDSTRVSARKQHEGFVYTPFLLLLYLKQPS